MRKEVQLIWILAALLAFIFFIAATMKGPIRARLTKIPLLAKAIQKTDKFTRPYHDSIGQITSELKIDTKPKASNSGKVSPVEKAGGERIALFFKDGTKMDCVLLKETKDLFIVNWKGVDFDIQKQRVSKVVKGAEALRSKPVLTDEEIISAWPYNNDIVIRLTNRIVLDAKIKKVEGDKITLLYSANGGGYIEQEIDRSRIEYLIFKPIVNEKSLKIEKNLKELFPKMQFYNSGSFTIVTDSYSNWVNRYEAALKEEYTEIYLRFFELFKDKKPLVGNYVVVFDSIIDYIMFAITDFVPGWLVPGYFMPTTEVLYLYNVLGEKFSELLFKGLIGETGSRIDDIVENYKDRHNIDDRYDVFIDGQAMKIKKKFWDAYDLYRGLFRETTMAVLRHEFTHEVFHNWGLQSIIISEIKEEDAKAVEQKKKILESDDPKEIARLLRGLTEHSEEPFEIQAGNSWLAEGIATYCQTYPLGGMNNDMLLRYQQMERESSIYPLEALMCSKIGSWPGIAPKAQSYSYGQSWGFVKFLMDNYRDEFFAYHNKLSSTKAEGEEDIQWLLDSLGKSIQELRAEFKAYMDKFEKVEDPIATLYGRLYEIAMD